MWPKFAVSSIQWWFLLTEMIQFLISFEFNDPRISHPIERHKWKREYKKGFRTRNPFSGPTSIWIRSFQLKSILILPHNSEKKKQFLLWLTSEILLQPWTYKINSVINLGLPQWIFPESNLISRHQNSKLARSETAVPSIICQNPDPPPYSLVSSNKFNSCRSTCGTIYFI